MNILLTVIAYFCVGYLACSITLNVLNGIIAEERTGCNKGELYESEIKKVNDEVRSIELTLFEYIHYGCCLIVWPVWLPILTFRVNKYRKVVSENLKRK